MTLSDLDPPNGYTISGEGQGGIAGFAKGGAKVILEERTGGTLLSYMVSAQVGGKLAQLGARLIDATAKSMAEQFFTKFAVQLVHVAAPSTEPDALSAPSLVSPSAFMPARPRRPIRPWLIAAVAAIVAVAVIWRLAS